MNRVVENKIAGLYEDSRQKGLDGVADFLHKIRGRHVWGPARARPGFHLIDVSQVRPGTLFIEVPAKRIEKMIMLGWLPE